MQDYDPLKIDIDAPEDAITEGLFEVPYGMKIWRNVRNDFVVLPIHFSADPEKNSVEFFKSATAGLRPDQIEREYLLKFNSRGGKLAFPFLKSHPNKYLVKSSKYHDGDKWFIPRNWPLIAGLDYGGNAPTSLHIYAIDHKKRFHSIWEFYKPSHYVEIAEELLTHPLYDRLLYIVADISMWNRTQSKDEALAFTSLAELIEGKGVYKLKKSYSKREAGLARMFELFNPSGRPRFFFSTDCKEQFREFQGLRYKQETAKQLENRNLSEDIVKKDDHSYDDARYAAMSWDWEAEIDIETQGGVTFEQVEQEIDDMYDLQLDSIFI